MTMRILTGQKYNLLERGIVTVAAGSHPQLGQTRLYDGRPSRAWRSSSLAAAQGPIVDGNLITDGVTDFGGFEPAWVAGTPQGWTEANGGTGTVTEETGIVNSGAKSAKLTAGNGFGLIYRDVVVKSGEWINISSALRGDGTGIAGLRIYNPLTRNFLQTDGTWAAANVRYRQQTAASWSVVTAAVQVESYAACQSDLVSLRVDVFCSTVGQVGYADDIYVWPRVNFASIHGHNLDPGIGLQLYSSTDNFAGGSNVVEVTGTVTSPSCYMLMTAGNQDRRYWKIRLVNIPSTYPEIGEAVIGYARQPLQQFENPLESDSRWDRLGSITPSGERHIHKRSKWQIRSRIFNYRYFSQAEHDEGLELFHLRPEGDTYPVVIVPDHDKPIVIHGRLDSTFGSSRDWTAGVIFNDVTVVLNESPFASTAF